MRHVIRARSDSGDDALPCRLSALDFSKRAELTELMDEPCSREVMQACLRDLSRVNRWFLGYRPTLSWLESLAIARFQTPVHIVDVGCGYGDSLRRIETMGKGAQDPRELTGCDLNPDAIAIAAEASPSTSRSSGWPPMFSFTQGTGPIDIVLSSLFTHHLSEE